MAVCPKCGMEYVEGIKVCTDCKVELIDPEILEEAAQMIAIVSTPHRELAQQLVDYLEYCNIKDTDIQFDEDQGLFVVYCCDEDSELAMKHAKILINDYREKAAEAQANMEDTENDSPSRMAGRDKELDSKLVIPEADDELVYTTKKNTYAELHSSAVSFLIVGVIALVVAILMFAGVINLPLAESSKMMMRIVLAVISVLFILIGITSLKKANGMKSAADEEEERDKNVLKNFYDYHSVEEIEALMGDAANNADEALLSFQRLEVIKELLIRDLGPNQKQAYLDALSDEIYAKFYES